MKAMTVVLRQSQDSRHDEFVCVSCHQVFQSGKGFSDHFVRRQLLDKPEHSIEIIGCITNGINGIPA